jgi:hypothetical protein
MSSGIFQLNGVEATEPDGNVSIIPSGGFGYPDRLSNLLVSELMCVYLMTV